MSSQEPQRDRKTQPVGVTQPNPRLQADLATTQKTHIRPEAGRTPPGNPPPPRPPNPQPTGDGSLYQILLVIAYFAGALLLVTAFSTFLGFRGGRSAFAQQGTATVEAYLVEQFQLGLADMEAGNLEIARQRFEYIFVQDPSNQAAADRWVEISLILNVTATVTPPPEAATATPTEDRRPIEELYNAAIAALNGRNWDEALQTLSSLRKADPSFHVADVDGMIFTALRNRGVDKILNRGELEGGLYDFSQAELFQPLDRDALIYQGWARLYLQGKAFYGAYPEVAAGYFGQLANAIPGLKDGSGRTAWFLYWSSLVQIGDLLAASEDWCEASEAYSTALNAGNDNTVAVTAAAAQQNCTALTPTITPTFTMTATATPTLAGPTFTPTNTSAAPSATPTVGGATNTPTATSGAATSTPTATSGAPTSTATSAPPSDTATPIPATSTPTTEPPTATPTP